MSSRIYDASNAATLILMMISEMCFCSERSGRAWAKCAHPSPHHSRVGQVLQVTKMLINDDDQAGDAITPQLIAQSSFWGQVLQFMKEEVLFERKML